MNVENHIINADKWIVNYYDYLHKYTRSRISNLLDVEEIISDTFLAALKAKDNFKNKSNERTWLTAILKHKIIDYYRQKSSMKGKIEQYMLSHEEYEDIYHYNIAITQREESTLSDIYFHALKNVLNDSLAKIPKSQSNVLKMRIYQELSTEEICDRLDISKNNAWVLMNRARKALAVCLTKYDYAI
ncbi:sigma-70 family RNA polymerase sigma factor [uncultured Aquimarina sp.]|uniref:RNA polymerase sigma factor n=1 Tax=uncultured Aquimarina sp. TaxID=575652 RepID=UPI00261DA6A8|nr:sigma-70 family RNA polymerase sigma factor [uncultured Aquimarina sp.]